MKTCSSSERVSRATVETVAVLLMPVSYLRDIGVTYAEMESSGTSMCGARIGHDPEMTFGRIIDILLGKANQIM